jgi:hypothetical protein
MTTSEKYKRFDAADHLENLDGVAPSSTSPSTTPSSTRAPSLTHSESLPDPRKPERVRPSRPHQS